MESTNLNDMIKGWFIGNFNPTCYKSDAVEVAIKKYKKGDYEKAHYHKIATEFTVIIVGKVRMNDTIYEADSIVRIEPSEVTDFECLEDAITAVVKLPSQSNDKYII